MKRHDTGSVTLTSRSREILAEAARYVDDYGQDKNLPDTISRKKVWGIDGDCVVGEKLLPHDGTAEITVTAYDTGLAARWLAERKWDQQPDFEEAWTRICAALVPPPWRHPKAAQKRLGKPKRTTIPHNGGDRPREIVINCAGVPRPGVMWFEIVFIELCAKSFSIYARTGDVDNKGAESPKLVATVSAPLTWREVLKFVRGQDVAKVDSGFGAEIEIDGVEPWQKDVIRHAMQPHWEIDPFLRAQSASDLKLLYELLGGLLSDESTRMLARLGCATRNEWLKHKSLTRVAQIVGATDPRDLEKLVDDIKTYNTHRSVELVLSKYHTSPTIPTTTFLELLSMEPPRSVQMRAELFDCWMRSDPKPCGGDINGMGMDNEFPVLHWILREYVGGVFAALVDQRRQQLQEFVLWLLGEARYFAEYFSPSYEYTSYVVYAYGRPRFEACARLALEVENAALALGFNVPDDVRLPDMPTIDDHGWAVEFASSRQAKAFVRRMRKQQDD
jgi:hypothetical protein